MQGCNFEHFFSFFSVRSEQRTSSSIVPLFLLNKLCVCFRRKIVSDCAILSPVWPKQTHLQKKKHRKEKKIAERKRLPILQPNSILNTIVVLTQLLSVIIKQSVHNLLFSIYLKASCFSLIFKRFCYHNVTYFFLLLLHLHHLQFVCQLA